MTGLRPKSKGGHVIAWDKDNDAANEICLALRELAVLHSVAILIVHHTGRDETRYRGPIEWKSSSDVMFGLLPDQGRTKVVVEKNRDGKFLPPFHLQQSWDEKAFHLAYSGSAAEGGLGGKAKEADIYLRGKREASQAEIQEAVGCARSTMQEVTRRCREMGLWEEIGKTPNGSPIYRHTGAQG